MNLEEKFVLMFAIILILTPSFEAVYEGKITATDWLYRHTMWIEKYLKGDFSPIFNYPPLFEFLMLIPVYYHVEIYFQIIFAVITLCSLLYMVHFLENDKIMLLFAVFIAVSVSFQFYSALMPQALDYFLFALAVVFYFKNKVKYTIPILLIDLFMHGTGIIFIGIMFLHSLLTKRYKIAYIFLSMMILLFPIFYYYTFIAYWGFDSQAQYLSDMAFLNPLWRIFALSGILTWIVLPYAFYKFARNKYKLTETQLLYVIWLVAFLPLPLFNMGWWRMFSYMTVPLSILVASLVSK